MKPIVRFIFSLLLLLSFAAFSFCSNDDDNIKVIKSGKKGWLGVHIQSVDSKLVKKHDLKVKEGAFVTDVEKKSPADSAGIKEDDVIIEVDGRQIYDADDLVKSISRIKPGTKANVVVMRNNEKKSLTAIISKNPANKFNVFAMSKGAAYTPFMYFLGHGRMGAEVMDLNDQLGEYFGIKDGKGVLVKSVKKKSPAEKAGLKAGDVITKIDKETIKKSGEISEALSDFESGDKVNIEVIRKGVPKNLTIELEDDEEENNFNFHFNMPDVGINIDSCIEINEDCCKNININSDHIKIEMDKIKPNLEKLKPMLKHIQINMKNHSKGLKVLQKELQEKIQSKEFKTLQKETQDKIQKNVRYNFSTSI
jgi:membrane-associated protease RseP (regulator of RpoE activity)